MTPSISTISSFAMSRTGTLLLGAYPATGCCGLELPSLRGLHIVTATTEFLEDSGAQHLLFESTEGAFDVIAFGQGDLSHAYRPSFTTFSAAGPFWPWTMSNSTFSPSARDLNPEP